MNKHLKYIDGNSDKFWQIEVNDASYTVTYGKNGTSGTSQTKSFETKAECLKTAEKLLNEKIKKGYSENGEVLVSQGTPKAGKSSGRTKTDSAVAIEAYDHLIKSKDKRGLLPFLEVYAKGNVEALQKHIKKSRRYWLDYVDLSKDPDFRKQRGSDWGRRADEVQTNLVALSAIALLDRTAINSWDEAFQVLRDANEPFILEVLNWAKPSWIGDFLLERAKRNEWQRCDYSTLRFLETGGLIDFQPELYALCLGGYNEWSSALNSSEFLQLMVNDPVAHKRDVPELFNYETSLNNSVFGEKGNKNYDPDKKTWSVIYDTLLAEDKLDRNYFIEQVILIQTKEWNNTLKSFFRKKITDLDVQANELLLYQESIFACLQHATTPVANFAVDLIKKMYEHEAFQAGSFLDWLEPMMMSGNHKGAVKSILTILEKLYKQFPEYHKKITALLADVYVIPDLGLQEKTSKLLLKLAPENDAELREKLTAYAALMQGNVRNSLAGLMDADTDLIATESFENYQYQPEKVNVLLEEVRLPQDWNDIVFLFGKFITSDEVIDAELLLNTFINQKHLFPEDYVMQLQPYHKQLQKNYFLEIYKHFACEFLEQKILDYNSQFKPGKRSYPRFRTLSTTKSYLDAVQKRMNSGKQFPMLSFPTHLPHWVEPRVLLERLITCQREGEEIDKLDLSMAISRMPRENTEAAIPLLEQLQGEMKDLMAFCLGVNKNIAFKTDSVLDKLISVISAPKDEHLKAVWAVAARTYYPDDTFMEFEKTYLKDIPFVVSPFKPSVTIEEKWHEYKNYETKEKVRTPSWYEMDFSMPGYQKVPEYFLYGVDMFKKGSLHDESMYETGNVYHWDSLLPQNPDAMAIYLLRSSCFTSTDGGQELKGFLNVLERPGFRHSETVMLVFACTFLQEKKEIRLMAAEILINLVERQAVNIVQLSEKIAFLAANKYGPFSRIVDGLGSLKDNSPLHNAAFLQMMEVIFKATDTTEKLPTNFKKLVEHYVDVLSKTNQRPAAAVSAVFEKLKDSSALKTLVKQILK